MGSPQVAGIESRGGAQFRGESHGSLEKRPDFLQQQCCKSIVSNVSISSATEEEKYVPLWAQNPFISDYNCEVSMLKV